MPPVFRLYDMQGIDSIEGHAASGAWHYSFFWHIELPPAHTSTRHRHDICSCTSLLRVMCVSQDVWVRCVWVRSSVRQVCQEAIASRRLPVFETPFSKLRFGLIGLAVYVRVCLFGRLYTFRRGLLMIVTVRGGGGG